MLWRHFLVQRRAQVFTDQADLKEILHRLSAKSVTEELRTELEKRAADIRFRLEPPIVNRPTRSEQKT